MSPTLRRPPDPAGGLTPPPELVARLVVEDWLSPEKFTPRPTTPATVEDWTWAAHGEARRRWKAARRAWLDEHQVPAASECETIPMRCPSFADEEAVRAIFARRLGTPTARRGRRARGADR
jgi:hypothetical protein